MNILQSWGQLLTLTSIKTIGALWWQNTREFFRILVRDWWWLVIAAFAGQLLIINPLVSMLSTDISPDTQFTILLLLNGIVIEGLILLTCLAFGMLSAATLIIAHATEHAQNRRYYKSHILFFVIITLITGFIFSVFMFSMTIREDSTLTPSIFMAFEQLYFYLACFFILDARPSIWNYLRAITILPIKIVALNLPIFALLYLIFIPLNLAPSPALVLAIAPLTIVLYGVIYKLAVTKDREAYS